VAQLNRAHNDPLAADETLELLLLEIGAPIHVRIGAIHTCGWLKASIEISPRAMRSVPSVVSPEMIRLGWT